MHGPAQEPSVPALVTALAERTAAETELLVTHLRARCWPGGATDRHEPGALEWVRRWGPYRATAEPLDCSCIRGRCAFCN